MTYNFNCWR